MLVCRKHEETASGDKVQVLIAPKDVGVDKMAKKTERAEKKLALERMQG